MRVYRSAQPYVPYSAALPENPLAPQAVNLTARALDWYSRLFLL